MCKKLIQSEGSCTEDIGREDMVTASLRMSRRFEPSSGEFAEIVKAAEQSAAATTPVSLATSSAKELFSSISPHAARRQQTCHIASVGDALDARRHKMRRCSEQTVQHRMEIV
jgi:K+-transporting ATPase c subunit